MYIHKWDNGHFLWQLYVYYPMVSELQDHHIFNLFKKKIWFSENNIDLNHEQFCLHFANFCTERLPFLYYTNHYFCTERLPFLYYTKHDFCTERLPFLIHLVFRPCELLPSLFVRRPSVNISHFNLVLGNHWANFNQTLVEWSLDGPFPNLCPVIPISNQDGHQAKNRKKGGRNFNCSLLL